MNGLALIHRLTERLKSVNPTGAQGELRWILKTQLSVPILDLSLDEKLLTDTETAHIEKAVDRRLAGEPLAYILKEAPFMDFSLHVDEGVLIPRIETEILVSAAAGYCLSRWGEPLKALDLGAGTGNIPIGVCTLADNVVFDAVEYAPRAIGVLERNLETFHLRERVQVFTMDYLRTGLGDLPGPYDLVTANPPYIAEADYPGLEKGVQKEPREALVAGPKGDEVLRWIACHAPTVMTKGARLIVEIGMGQAEAVADAAEQLGELSLAGVLKDHQDIDRVMIFEKRK